MGKKNSELGVRMALGLDRRHLTWLVLRQALLIGAAGVAAGVLGSLALYRLIQNLLYELALVDPVSLTSSALFLLAIAVADSFSPFGAPECPPRSSSERSECSSPRASA